MTDFRQADLGPADLKMLEFAVKLTLEPKAMEEEDLQALRAVGFGDQAIHDIVQVAVMFNYYNRLADGLGLEPEPT